MKILLFLIGVASLTMNAQVPADGKVTEVAIGKQIWKTTNLDVTTYRDGTPIPEVTDPQKWAKLTTGAWCYYNNDAANGATYGKLYNWYAIIGKHDNNPKTPNKILAPKGWHVPNDEEWRTLTTFLEDPYRAGNKMKETGSTHWNSSNEKVTNSSGFTGLPGGSFSEYGFINIGGEGKWWSTQEWSSWSNASNLTLTRFDEAADRSVSKKSDGLSVRCVKD